MKIALSLLAVAMLSACAPMPTRPPRPTVVIDVPFDAAQAKAMLTTGVNFIKGNAFMRQRGGGVVTCAGMNVVLTPATAYATKRIWNIYGNTVSGFSDNPTPPAFTPDYPEYMTLVKMTKCDSQGNFTFDRVADGEFYITTSVAWMAGSRLQGGNLMAKVKVENGASESVILSH